MPDGLGVNIHFLDPKPGEMDLLAGAGFRWVRIEMSWEETEYQKGKYNFVRYENLLSILEKHNIRPIFILGYTNPFYDQGLSPYTQKGRMAFSHWAAKAASHFKNHGILWEIYNEPEWAWQPRSNYLQDYIKLALAVAQEIHKSAPQEAIIGPASSEIALLTTCFKSGLLKYLTAVSVHPYRGERPETAIEEFHKLRKIIEYYTPKNKKIEIISGEWGYPSISYRGNILDEQIQSKYIARQLLNNLSNGVVLSIWYDWRDDGLDPKSVEHHFGIVRNSYRANQNPIFDLKAAYYSVKTLTQTLKGFHFEKRLNTGKIEDYVLKFKNNKTNQVRFAIWSTLRNEHKILMPIYSGSFWLVKHSDNKKTLLIASKYGLRVSLTDSPQYLIQKK